MSLEALLANVIDEYGVICGDRVCLEVPDKVLHPRNFPVQVELIEDRNVYRLSTAC